MCIMMMRQIMLMKVNKKNVFQLKISQTILTFVKGPSNIKQIDFVKKQEI